MAQDQAALSQQWQDQAKHEPTGGVEDIDALIREAHSDPSRFASAAAVGEPINAADLFPDDQWDDVPFLDRGLWRAMVESGSPFDILGVMSRSSDYGPMFKVVIEVEGGLPFSIPFSYKPEYQSRNVKLARVAAMLESGAPRVGPFVFTCSDLDDPKAWQSFKAYRPAVNAKPEDAPRGTPDAVVQTKRGK